MKTRAWFYAFAAGLLFGGGLVVSGLGRPDMVLGAFSLGHEFNPRALVGMGSAVFTTALLHRCGWLPPVGTPCTMVFVLVSITHRTLLVLSET